MYIISEREDGRWQIKKKGSSRATKVCDSKSEAIAYCQSKGYEYQISVKVGNSSLNIDTKTIKKHKNIIIPLLIIIILLAGGLFGLVYFGVIQIPNLNFGNSDHDDHPTIIDGEDFSIHFLELGNKYTGDSTYIKAGDIDILIDAGSRQDSADDIINYVDQYCTDGKLEYVIATHAHQDHIAAFSSTSSRDGIFAYYEVETIIDFGMTNATSTTYKNYVKERDAEIAGGAVHYSADELFGTNAKHSNVFELGDGTILTVLEQAYYTEGSSDENNYSVCTLFTNGGNNYLLTGDLEKEGEESLVELNPDLPHCELFKAGHHGSKTSSNEPLLEMITPEIVTVCCCAGSEEYTDNSDNMFPTQDFINRVARYTDQIYVTSLAVDYANNEFTSFNGNIVVSSSKDELNSDGSYKIKVNCSNNNTILKETAWFKETIYVDSSGNMFDKDGNRYTASSPGVSAVPRRVWPSYGV